jgi:hypothetical protein
MSFSLNLGRVLDRFIGGRGEFSITVPVMDGALKPNDALEQASGMAMIPEVDNAVTVKGGLLVSSGTRILELKGRSEPRVHSDYQAPVSCVATSKGGALAVGLDGLGVRIVGGRYDGLLINRIGAGSLNCPTSACFLGEETLIVSNGSAQFPAAQWRHDFIHHGRSGTVARVDLARNQTEELASGLHFPAGLCLRHGTADEVLVSEAWRHRLVVLAADRSSSPREMLAGLPAYPGRICASASGGYWVVFFAVRSQLQEFVLRESRFRRRMIAEINPEFWIAPSLSSGRSFKEPLQAGGVIRLGIHKPWAPTRSYGLVVRLDRDGQPVESAHSRADGARHGVTSVVEMDGRLVLTSKGKGEVIEIAAAEGVTA